MCGGVLRVWVLRLRWCVGRGLMREFGDGIVVGGVVGRGEFGSVCMARGDEVSTFSALPMRL